MTRRIQIDPPIGRDGFNCRHCGHPIYAYAKVVHDDERPAWFVYQHGTGSEVCPSKTIAEPFDEVQAHAMVSAQFDQQTAPAGEVEARSRQSVRVATALERLHAAESARREHLVDGDRKAAGEASGALRGVIEDLPIHDLRSLTLRLFLDSVKPAEHRGETVTSMQILERLHGEILRERAMAEADRNAAIATGDADPKYVGALNGRIEALGCVLEWLDEGEPPAPKERPAPVGSWWRTDNGAVLQISGDYLDGPGDQIVTYTLYRQGGGTAEGKWGGKELAEAYTRIEAGEVPEWVEVTR